MIQLLAGDCRDVLPTLAADSVHCVVTSPPYYGLRDYGTALWDGGDAACGHISERSTGASTLKTDGRAHPGILEHHKVPGVPFRDTCGKCGAVRIDRQIGLEATPDLYLATMVAVFREVRRVMRNDAVAFINMGDGYRDKQLLLMPARLALALQADGWWVRSDIIWHKPNPMPESCTDRPTSAHEHVFLLSKARTYYYDADAVREEPTGRTDAMGFRRWPGANDQDSYALDATRGRNLRNVWTLATQSFPDSHFATFPTALAERCIRAGTSEKGCCSAMVPKLKLRDDLTEAQRARVYERLGSRGIV